MKTAVLILITLVSLVLCGQNKIEYENFEFRRNGQILSKEQVEDLTDSLFTGQYRFYLAKKQLYISQSSKRTMIRNLTNLTSAYVLIGGGVSVIYAVFDPVAAYALGDIGDLEDPILLLTGSILTASGLNIVRCVGGKSNYERRADKNFRRVAISLNNRLSKETGN